MNEQKLREMMKIYTVSKQVNKKAEKNFLKFSHQFYKMHKAEMTPELLTEINSLRQQIKEEKQNFSKQTSPIISPRLSDNPKYSQANQSIIQDLVNENQQKIDFAILEGAHTQIFKLYIEEIKDLKQQLNKATQEIETQRKSHDIKLETLNHQLVVQKSINDDLKKEIKVLKQIVFEKFHNTETQDNSFFKSLSNQNSNETQEKCQISINSTSNSFISKEKSLELFQQEIEKALNSYRQEKQINQGKDLNMFK